MARFTRIEVVIKMKESGIIPVFYHPDATVVGQVLKACYDEGIRVFEFTNRGDFAHEVFADVVKQAAREFPEMIPGVGSVIDGGTASLYIQLGANFIVSPALKEDIAIVCNRRKIAWMPGCGSLNDISRAEELGAEVVKIFPGSSVGGPPFVAAVKGPCPWTSIMPTGGVEATEENLKAWFDAGVTCVGMGSNLFPKNLIAAGQWDAVRRKVRNALDILKKVRG
jgi:2-dehydro-3-deoxyphosphogluconate aldolase/(4S)-4-hydroxy-2-oxoglutarate aldolase